MENNRKSPLKQWKKGPTRDKEGLRMLPASSVELGEEPGETARILYGPDAYLNLPHLQCNFNPPIKSQNLKWFLSKNFISMFPSSGLFNINAQTSVHLIHQRLEDLKKNGVIDPLLLVLPIPGEHEEKPQIDLNEFLQQLGMPRDECQSEGSNMTESLAAPESSLKDDNELVGFAEESFSLDALIKMCGIEDHQGADASNFQGYGLYEEPAFPPYIWNV
ncbi:Dehydration-responsive element-binding protein 2F [Vitis vinifera]|uniref:Dehydration-responsive element-binding protein 2F n=1 Tax=Vitis vinifera TaxID=29760 RepID=A0A438BZU4_VITVI|nr:Dehydration-responsive element-binding protein 2F [Vitis vinifera]